MGNSPPLTESTCNILNLFLLFLFFLFLGGKVYGKMIVGAGSKMIESAFLLFLFTVTARGDAMSQNNTDGRRMDFIGSDWFKAKIFEFFYHPSDYDQDGGEDPREIYNICNEPRMTGKRKTEG